jgi:hypothetical protein
MTTFILMSMMTQFDGIGLGGCFASNKKREEDPHSPHTFSAVSNAKTSSSRNYTMTNDAVEESAPAPPPPHPIAPKRKSARWQQRRPLARRSRQALLQHPGLQMMSFYSRTVKGSESVRWRPCVLLKQQTFRGPVMRLLVPT